jgi:hypothetical protein
MSQPAETARLNCSPLFVTLQNGFERLMEIVPKESFAFFVKDEEIKSTVAEAVLISRRIHENLQCSPGNRIFRINDERITANNFRRFLELIHCHSLKEFSEEDRLSFLLISELLGNDELTYLLIGTLRERYLKDSNEDSETEIEANHCASQFYDYSIEEIVRIEKRILHEILSSRELKLKNEDELLKTLIQLGSDYFEYWCYIEVNFLSDEGIVLFVDNIRFDDLTESIWDKIADRLCNRESKTLNSARYLCVEGFESKIVKYYPSILKEFMNRKWKLLYQGSRDGFGSSHFHGKCDNQSNTLTIIETTTGFIFGGFTPAAWDSSGGYKSDNSQTSFLFSLKNPRNSSPQRFRLSNVSNAIYCHSIYGPVFGNGCDIVVWNGCNANTNSNSNFGTGYVNDTGIAGNQVFTGERNFTVKEIEVFAINL